ncbi:hypothetical protein [Pluralibacter gergoviae]|uniref:hypothetical protein n=1 Tax=Pluralibacter gergoviae TaxID=61647 RepID=UPI001FF4E541|nr:hypothetical protein [Pluralibacter gergoviae]MCK1065026.1 hypothetical protein [Pluralibacter gergoviae]
MTLLEILVKELPWKGGWPVGACLAVQDADSQLCFSSTADVRLCSDGTDWTGGKWYGSWSNEFIDTLAEDRQWAIITREQYEAALADSKKMAWNGEGLPPVGCECEWEDKTGWFPVKIKYLSEWVIVFSGLTMDGEEVDIAKNLYADDVKFRPIRSEEERKRDESLAGLKKSLGHASDLFDVMRIYSAIAAGKIPHVKIV